jgi:hypothetical protein
MVGLIFVLAGGWLFLVNVAEVSYSGGVLVWILLSGLVGATGGVLFLLSIDGPMRFRTRRTRLTGWVMMWALVVLPTALILVLAPMMVCTIPALTSDRDSPPMTPESAN